MVMYGWLKVAFGICCLDKTCGGIFCPGKTCTAVCFAWLHDLPNTPYHHKAVYTQQQGFFFYHFDVPTKQKLLRIDIRKPTEISMSHLLLKHIRCMHL